MNMRSKIVFVVLLALLGGVAYGLFFRGRAPHVAPPLPKGSLDASTDSRDGEVLGDAAAPADASAADAGPKPLLARPLRVVGLGWDVIAPAVLAAKNSSAPSFASVNLQVSARGVEKMENLESALARGGDDADGADVAVLPLASFVASYERLRALSPQVFMVTAWSRGREALYSTKNPLASAAPLSGEVKLAGAPSEPATYFGLTMLGLAGVAQEQLKVVAPNAKVEDVTLVAVDRSVGDPAGAKLRMTTADASRLIPFVAIAQRGTIESHGPALVAWARVWLDAQRSLDTDATNAARTVASVQGAPEPIALLRKLGELSPASLGDNARAVGLSGRSGVTLETSFQRAWQTFRGAGVLATPPPDSAPVNTSVIAALVRAEPELAKGLASGAAVSKTKPGDPAGKVLLVHRLGDGTANMNDASIVASLGFVAGVFERSAIRVTIKSGGTLDTKRAQKIIDAAQGQFDIAAGRLTVGTKPAERASAAIEVLEQ